tara:strand:+ start:509 stop:766 length:258 start_codon:yes stop_codon:yes gene_type:complete
MDINEMKEYIGQHNDEALLADGFEGALMGVGVIFDKSLAAYDMRKCIDILIERDGMSEEEAVEYFEFNVTGSYVGENTPIFVEVF